ncbi:MAG: carboxypeptidase regulatory-like domain-containing protein [Gemmatimonas sp.]
MRLLASARHRVGTTSIALSLMKVFARALVATFVMISAAAAAPASLHAQDTAAVVTNGSISGVVIAPGGIPLAGATVSLVGENASTVTDSTGRFVLRDIAPGAHIALVRRIGYQSFEQRFAMRPGAAMQFMVTMRVIAQQMNQIVVEAKSGNRRRGNSSISGSVADSAGRPVANADVRLLGSGMSTVTDSGGNFQFRTLAAGPYIVRSRKEGLAAGNAVMQIADDDDRSISIKMWGLPRGTKPRDVAVASGYKVADLGFDAFDRRARSRSQTLMMGPGDLFRENGAPLDFVLRQYRETNALTSRRVSGAEGDRNRLAESDCVLIDGRRASNRPLSSFTSISVVLLEVFRTNSFVDDYVLSEMQAIRECQGTMMRHPSYFVLWTRTMR